MTNGAASLLPRAELAHRFGRELENGTVQPVTRLANRELRRMDADRDATRARVAVVARERALSPFVEHASRGERERMRRNRDATPQMSARGP